MYLNRKLPNQLQAILSTLKFQVQSQAISESSDEIIGLSLIRDKECLVYKKMMIQKETSVSKEKSISTRAYFSSKNKTENPTLTMTSNIDAKLKNAAVNPNNVHLYSVCPNSR